jgi:hypothetical protein
MSDDSKSTTLKQEVMDKIAALVTAAFGLVAALAWNDAIKAVFKEVFGTADAVGPMLIYAIIITIFAVILTVTVAKAASKAKSIMDEEIFECKLCDYTSKIESKFIEHTIKDHAASQDKFLSK